MKKLLLALAFAVIASAAHATPVNKACPVGSRPVRNDITVTHKGEQIAFCCNNCKKKFEADPAKYEGNIKKG